MSNGRERFERAIEAAAEKLEHQVRKGIIASEGPKIPDEASMRRRLDEAGNIAASLRKIVTDGRAPTVRRGTIEAFFRRAVDLGCGVPDVEVAEVVRAHHAFRPEAPF